MGAAHMGNRMTSLTATNKAPTVDPTIARTETLRAATENRMAPTVAASRAAMVEPINRTETPKVGMDNQTTPTETLKAGTDNQTTPMGVTEAVTVNPTTIPTGTPRAAMDNRMTCTAAKKVATVDPTTNPTRTPRAATADRKVPTEAAPLVVADRMITLMGATKEVMANLTTPITLVPTGNRKNAAAVRGYTLVVRNVC